MCGGKSRKNPPPVLGEGDDFYPLPEYVASLIPPADAPVFFDRFVAVHAVGDERKEASYFVGPQEGSSGCSGIDEGCDQRHGGSHDDSPPKSWEASPAASATT
jgi:hypothetical protein